MAQAKWEVIILTPDELQGKLNDLEDKGWHIWPQLIKVLPTMIADSSGQVEAQVMIVTSKMRLAKDGI